MRDFSHLAYISLRKSEKYFSERSCHEFFVPFLPPVLTEKNGKKLFLRAIPVTPGIHENVSATGLFKGCVRYIFVSLF